MLNEILPKRIYLKQIDAYKIEAEKMQQELGATQSRIGELESERRIMRDEVKSLKKKVEMNITIAA